MYRTKTVHYGDISYDTIDTTQEKLTLSGENMKKKFQTENIENVSLKFRKKKSNRKVNKVTLFGSALLFSLFSACAILFGLVVSPTTERAFVAILSLIGSILSIILFIGSVKNTFDQYSQVIYITHKNDVYSFIVGENEIQKIENFCIENNIYFQE